MKKKKINKKMRKKIILIIFLILAILIVKQIISMIFGNSEPNEITLLLNNNLIQTKDEIIKEDDVIYLSKEEDVFELLKDEEYIDSLIEKYWFLTDEIKDENIYYPLEGYLLPDTYTFESVDVSVETIFNVILNFTDKFLSEYKDDFKYTVHQTLTLASMAEMEGKSFEDREEIIGVFLNRIDIGMSLGSDVTTYYAFGVDMGESDLTKKQINTYNPYNTRGPDMISKIPIGPICNMSKDAIKATLTPKETEALYFVADKNGKVYFTKTNEEHNEIITKLKDEGLWFTY